MSRRFTPSPGSFFRNFTSGSYGVIERLRVTVGNIRRKGGGKGCCGNYGDPGC